MAATRALPPGAADPHGRGLTMQPFFFSVQGRALFGALHRARQPRALLLMCPPLLHEHVRSYRFFSQLAERFASAGVTCLRFDYFGTGDSAGPDDAFVPATALSDIAGAAGELRSRGGPHPLILMGIRASALLAAPAAVHAGADALWLWQPETDGAHYLDALDAQDLAARSDPGRYPGPRLPRPDIENERLGFKVDDGFRRFMRQASLCEVPDWLAVDVTVRGGDPVPDIAHAVVHPLTEAAADWAWDIDFPRMLHARDASDAVDALLARLPQTASARGPAMHGEAAHG